MTRENSHDDWTGGCRLTTGRALGRAALVAAMMMIVIAGHAAGQCQAGQFAKLLAPDGGPNDDFGFSVAIEGDLAVIGADWHSIGGGPKGAVYVYRFDGATWNWEAKLTASDGAFQDAFGRAVAVSGDVILVGAYLDDPNAAESGSAYVFRHSGSMWVEEAKLIPQSSNANQFFGEALCLQGNTALIGARLDDELGFHAGAVYVFQHDGAAWVEMNKLFASDLAPGDNFGCAVALSGDTAVIGAWGDDVYASNSGSAYVFRLLTGGPCVQEAKLLPSDGGATDDYFGRAVAIEGNTVLIGAVGKDDGGNGSGAAYVYDRTGTTWGCTQKLIASDCAAAAAFGGALDLAGDTAVIGAFGADAGVVDTGAAYVFRRTGASWYEAAKLAAGDGASLDEFGNAVAIDDHVGIIGSHKDDDLGSWSGSAYAFHGLDDCNNNQTLDICDIQTGVSLDLNGNGVPDECENNCPEDVNGDNVVDVQDLLALLAAWGNTSGPEDINGDGLVDVVDLLALLAAWGPC